MTKFNDFFDEPKEEDNDFNMQKIDGVYGCQSCDKDAPNAFFNEKTGEIFWYCPEQHKSSIQVG